MEGVDTKDNGKKCKITQNNERQWQKTAKKGKIMEDMIYYELLWLFFLLLYIRHKITEKVTIQLQYYTLNKYARERVKQDYSGASTSLGKTHFTIPLGRYRTKVGLLSIQGWVGGLRKTMFIKYFLHEKTLISC